MLNVQIERLPNGLIRVFSLYTNAEVCLPVATLAEAQEAARDHIRNMTR